MIWLIADYYHNNSELSAKHWCRSCGGAGLQGVETISKVWFADLAAAATAAAGGSLRAVQASNRCLSALADCVEARCLGHKHIPYRNSKLTHLLQVRPLHISVVLGGPDLI